MDFKSVTLLEFLANSPLNTDVAVITQAYGQLDDGTPVAIELPDDLLTHIAELVAARVSMPGAPIEITTVRFDDDSTDD